MDKREKVMTGLDCCINHGKEPPRLGNFVCDFKNCPYEHYAGIPCYRILIKDALELLKVQEPMIPVYDQLLTQEIPRCGKCGYRLVKGNDKYCCRCGQAVKWDE